MDVVVANEPIPSVSKKFATKPMTTAIAQFSGAPAIGRARNAA